MFAATSLRSIAAAGAVALSLALPAPARGEEATTMGDSMVGIASAVCTLFYTPVKMVYATGGVGVGTLVWLFSAGDADSMNAVFKTAGGGDFVVTEEHLRGLRVLRFSGQSKRT